MSAPLDPLEYNVSERLFEHLVEGHHFERFPVDAIQAALSRAKAVLQLALDEIEEPQLNNALWSVEHELADALAMLGAAVLASREVKP